LLDIDGVLNPFFRELTGHDPPYCGCAAHRAWRKRRPLGSGDPLRVYVNPSHGPKLRKLAEDAGAQLMWASRWQEHAHLFGHEIGLPLMEVIPIADDKEKGAAVREYTYPAPVVWFDDEPDQFAGMQLMSHAHKLIAVDPAEGLTDDHIAQARDWFGIN
jgi:HAD domain in Swiss Army Knife RNA repair proteins